ncbi:bZIP transcription factor 17-like [Magnolia sinica]|uniref:bZIP transcription factor 17-like n=1 Tax=Magnolia sinica TaxID=86752 RepID=UPI002658BFE8|nr:bZIP transcription factor 17-like [Magnolia sinica]
MANEPPFPDPFQFEPDPPNPNFASAFESLSLPDDDISVDLTFPEGFMDDLGFEDDDLGFSIEDVLLLDFPAEDFNGGSGISSLSNVSQERGSVISGNLNPNPLDSPGRGCSEHATCGDRCSADRRLDVAQVLYSAPPDSPDRESSGSLSDDQSFSTSRFLNSPSPVSGSHDRELTGSVSGNRRSDTAQVREFSGSVSDDERSDASRALHPPSSGCAGHGGEISGSASSERTSEAVVVSDAPSPGCGGFDKKNSGSSGNQRSAAARVLDSPSPDSGSVSSSQDSSNITSDATADQKIKLEEGSKRRLLKRKKGKEDGNPDTQNNKFHRSVPTEDGISPNAFGAENDEEDKKKARLMRNRESAQLSRQRKKHYVEELEDKVRSLHCTIADLNGKMSFIMAENASLRQQLSGGSVCPPQPPPGIYPPPPMVPMHFPWVPCSSYPLKPQGSQVPLIPIPRLKPPQPASVLKAKAERKKAESKTKKVSSVSFMGLLFFLLIFGGLVPVVNLRYGGNRSSVSGGIDFVNDRHEGHSQGRVLTVTGHNGSDVSDEFELYNSNAGFGKHDLERIDRETNVKQKERGPLPLPGSEGFGLPGNASEPLVASLYVPRNDKLVKIDGNLIIHSVLASERAVASSHAAARKKSNKPTVPSDKGADRTGLAIAGNVASAFAFSKPGRDVEGHSHMYRSATERPRALASGSRDAYGDNMKSAATDGALQQWFREGLAGPILSSGMCTEVFQFDVSPASANPGAIIPARPVANVSGEHPPNSARPSKMKNRRFLYHPLIPLNGTTLNRTGENATKPPDGSTHFQSNKSVSSSMVVSVLVDPREAGVSNRMMRPKSLPRIFVVVLLDSVKYVTYSCVLPLKGAGGAHIVTT